MANTTLQQAPNTQADSFIRIQVFIPAQEPAARLLIDFNFSAESLDEKVLQAARKAPDNDDLMETLNGIVQLNDNPGNWKAWAMAGRKNVVTVRLSNHLDADKNKLPADQWSQGNFTLGVPRTSVQKNVGFSLNYQVRDASNRKVIQEGHVDIELAPAGSGADPIPVVRLWTDQKSPTALDPGTKVKISWRVDDAVSGVLKGPLPGDAQQMTLQDGNDSRYDLSAGSIYVRIAGSQIYLLQATVKTKSGAKVDVERNLVLDIASLGKKAFLHIFPDYILPYARVRAYWAAWGVSSATLIGLGKSQRLLPTGGNSNRSPEDDQEGEGDKYFRTGDRDADISLQITLGNKAPETAGTSTIHVVSWKDIETEGPFKQIGPVPLGLAVAWSESRNTGKLIGCNYDGIWMTDVGLGDFDTREARPKRSLAAEFAPPEVKLKKRLEPVALGEVAEWFAVTALGEGFAALLRPKAGGDPALVRFDLEKKEISRKTLPGSLRTWVSNRTASIDLMVLGERLFLRVAVALPEHAWHSEAWSTKGLDDRDGWREEPLPAGLPGFRFTTIGQVMYALQPETGRLLQFGLQPDGRLSDPRMAAPAVDGKGRSLVATGLPVAVGNVLAVLGSPRQENAQGEQKEPTDWVYNPQTDRWTDDCGQGLPLEGRACAAYRNTESKRLWVVDGARLYTLPVANGENLFAHDYLEGNQNLELPAYFDETARFVFTNQLLFDLLPPDAVCQAAGYYDTVCSDAARHALFPSGKTWETLGKNVSAILTLRYRKDDQPGFRLHWQIGPSGDPNTRSVLQVTARANKSGGAVQWTVDTAFLFLTLVDGKPSAEVLAQTSITAPSPDLKFSFPLPSIRKASLDLAIISPTVLSKDGKYAYAANVQNGALLLSQIDLSTRQVVKSVSPWPTAFGEHSLAMIARDKTSIFAVAGNALHAFDERLQETPLTMIAPQVGNVSNDVAVVQDFTITGLIVSTDQKVYLAGGIFIQPYRGDRNWLPMDYMARIDLTKPVNGNRLAVLPKNNYNEMLADSPVPMAISKNNAKVYAALRNHDLLVIDTASFSISYPDKQEHKHQCLYLSDDGQRLYSIIEGNPAMQLLKLNPGDLKTEKSLPLDAPSQYVNLSGYGAPAPYVSIGEYFRYLPSCDLLESPQGEDLIVAYGNSIRVVDLSTWTIRQTIALDTCVRLLQVLEGPMHTWKIRAWGRAAVDPQGRVLDNKTVLYEVLVGRG
ncbi:MAG TPA: hypothetical protein PLO67_07225 [Saprospiraceae bacterium]|nr:hypothetical protein [Saprospiraceae bacterium]